MPVIIDRTCPICKGQTETILHLDGSIEAFRCKCNEQKWNGHAAGEAFTSSHWWVLRVARAADKFTDCLNEFCESKSDCSCGACGEWLQDLEGAIGAAKQLGFL